MNYIGPDGQYAGKEIAFACNENTVTIVDVTDPTDATELAAEGYSTSAYTHQGWLTEDHRYFVVGDELDETSSGTNTRTYFFNVEDLNNPFLVSPSLLYYVRYAFLCALQAIRLRILLHFFEVFSF